MNDGLYIKKKDLIKLNVFLVVKFITIAIN